MTQGGVITAQPQNGSIKALVDLTHEWTFYFGGRFGQAYIDDMRGQHCASNRSLEHLRLDAFNLLVLHKECAPVEYTDREVGLVQEFAGSGGGVMLAGSFCQPTRGSGGFPLNKVASAFGCEFLSSPAVLPASYSEMCPACNFPAIQFPFGRTLRLQGLDPWHVLVRDAKGTPVIALRQYGRGMVTAVASPAMWDDKPKGVSTTCLASNTAFTRWLISELVQGKPDPSGNPCDQSLESECQQQLDGIAMAYPASLQDYALGIGQLYKQMVPIQEEIMGLPLLPGQSQRICLLATGGAAWSSGVALGIGVFWGGWPDTKYPMVELIGHESTHSWVLPFAEPLGNEGIATYVGIEIGKKMGYLREASDARRQWDIEAQTLDPGYAKIDIAGPEQGGMHAVWMAKYMYIIDTLRTRFGDDVMAKYFRLKRTHAAVGSLKEYKASDSVFLWGIASDENLFTWFRESLGIDVSESRSSIAASMRGFV